MAKKLIYNIDFEDILIAVLLIFSGNPITHFTGKYGMAVVLGLIYVVMYNKIKRDFYIQSLLFASGLILIFVSQNIVLGFVSWPGAFNYIVTFLFGGLVIYLLGDRFAHKFFTIMSYVALISLIFYPIINILNIHPPALAWGDDEQHYTYFVYTFAKEHQFRNCGMFWEPGAFAGMISLCVAFNVKEFPVLWKKHKFKVIVIILALLTTQSTTGYIIFFFIAMYFLLFFVKDKTIAFTVLPVLFVLAIVAYTNVTFLQQKLEEQSQSSLTLDQGEFSNTRFGSLIFDMHYVKKHPIIGNGFHETTRYADNPELVQLIEMGANLADANGFSNYLACLGIPFMFFYFLLTYKATSKIDTKTGILIVAVIFLTLFGEQWLNYPLYIGMVYVGYRRSPNKKAKVYPKRRYRNINYLPQAEL